jgi:hypothetical protein
MRKNGRLNDGLKTVHAIDEDRVTYCTIPWRGRSYCGMLTTDRVTCKMCIRILDEYIVSGRLRV